MLSIKQKQVLGVTSIVVLVVVTLSGLQLVSLTRTLVQQSRDRGEFIAMTIGHSAQDVVVSEESAFQDLRRSTAVRASLEAALYSEDVVYAAIVDRTGDDRRRSGTETHRGHPRGRGQQQDARRRDAGHQFEDAAQQAESDEAGDLSAAFLEPRSSWGASCGVRRAPWLVPRAEPRVPRLRP